MRVPRIIAGLGVLAFALVVGFLWLGPQSAKQNNGLAFAQGNSSQNSIREMMGRMMGDLVPPPGMTAERLPDPNSQGAQLVARYCANCHDLPSPQYKTADQWPAVFDRMLGRLEMMSGGGMMGRGMMGMGRIEAPTASEARTLLGYLEDHALREATIVELAVGNPSDREVFQAACSRCHALPSPSLHSPQDWPAVVARMEGNMQLMNKRAIATGEREAIVRYLREAAPKAHREPLNNGNQTEPRGTSGRDRGLRLGNVG